MKTLTTITLLLTLTHRVLSHYVWSALIINDQRTKDYEYIRKIQRPQGDENSPITDIQSTDIRCGYGSTTTGTTVSVANVKAGSIIGLSLRAHEHIYHDGPITVYMSKAPGNVQTYDGSGGWFKIAELTGAPRCTARFHPGLGHQVPLSRRIQWPATGKTEYKFKIPGSTPSGQYLVRIEQIGLHRASIRGAAEFFISCGHVNVVNGGSGRPDPMVKFPGAYREDDPGILVNIYDAKCYSPPGPEVWLG
ncbi:glycoside hydrolase [Aspergillus avenaceus]|uniref:lytic cellulose monooxygenase (C4-dehydrogenating) n=1 Tax=Aspergillus avenaceus TaxID=36643 RepID=A0A5N6TYZ7_ASPAV|nr:glycoside hydrolase [Aspergillus avenaceus]